MSDGKLLLFVWRACHKLPFLLDDGTRRYESVCLRMERIRFPTTKGFQRFLGDSQEIRLSLSHQSLVITRLEGEGLVRMTFCILPCVSYVLATSKVD